jgi:hypothetical protein
MSTILLSGELVRELSENSEDFRRLWARQDIKATPPNSRIFNHPAVDGWSFFLRYLRSSELTARTCTSATPNPAARPNAP